MTVQTRLADVEQGVTGRYRQPSARVALAAAYRPIANYNLDHSIFTHVSSRAPHEEGEHAFPIDPFTLQFNDLIASSLLAVDIPRGTYGLGINKAGSPSIAKTRTTNPSRNGRSHLVTKHHPDLVN